MLKYPHTLTDTRGSVNKGRFFLLMLMLGDMTRAEDLLLYKLFARSNSSIFSTKICCTCLRISTWKLQALSVKQQLPVEWGAVKCKIHQKPRWSSKKHTAVLISSRDKSWTVPETVNNPYEAFLVTGQEKQLSYWGITRKNIVCDITMCDTRVPPKKKQNILFSAKVFCDVRTDFCTTRHQGFLSQLQHQNLWPCFQRAETTAIKIFYVTKEKNCSSSIAEIFFSGHRIKESNF